MCGLFHPDVIKIHNGKRDYFIKGQNYRHLTYKLKATSELWFPPNMAAKDVTFVKRGMVFYVTELVCVPFILRDRSFILYQREIFVDKLSDLI